MGKFLLKLSFLFACRQMIGVGKWKIGKLVSCLSNQLKTAQHLKKEKNLFESVDVGGNQSFCKSSDKFNFKNSITVFQVFEEIQENKECVEIKRKKINVWRLNIITFDLYNKSPAEQLRAFVVGHLTKQSQSVN